MNRTLLILSSLLVLTAGCRHTQNVPTLPASHGHLSMAFDRYLKLPTRLPAASVPSGTPEEVVELDQASTVFADAVQVLKGQPTDQELQ